MEELVTCYTAMVTEEHLGPQRVGERVGLPGQRRGTVSFSHGWARVGRRAQITGEETEAQATSQLTGPESQTQEP